MKIKFFFSIITIFITATLVHALSKTGNIRFWQETSVVDFFDNELHNLIIKNNSGGEVRLPEPMVKTANDSIDNNIPRGSAFNSHGIYLHVWVESGNIFAQKFTPAGNPVAAKILINDTLISNQYDTKFRSALMDNGSFCIVWSDQESDNHTLYGQVVSQTNVKDSTNFIICNSIRTPAVWANNIDGNFWIMSPQPHNGYLKILVQKRDIKGGTVGSSFTLNADNPVKDETSVSVAGAENGSFIVAFGVNNENISTAGDVYIRKFSASGQPLTNAIKVIKEGKSEYQGNPYICADENNNFLTVWTDARDKHSGTSISLSIYGQFLNSQLKKLGPNFRINQPKYSSTGNADVFFKNGEFNISWLCYTGIRNAFYVTRWAVRQQKDADMISTILDTGPDGAQYNEFFWDASVPDTTNLRFQIRSGSDSISLKQANWFGPTGLNDFYTVASGESINPIHNIDRLIQYKALFHTDEIGITPVLNSVSISFSPHDSIPPSAPKGIFTSPGHSLISLYWSPIPDQGVAAYRIYRGKKSGYYDWKKDIPADESEYIDHLVKTGTTYYYVITAIDSSLNESVFSDEVTGTPAAMKVYVSPKGSPYGNGTIQYPFQTIAQGIHFAEYKDSVIVLPGEYHETVTMKKGVSLIGMDVLRTKLFYTSGLYIVKCAEETTLKGLSLIVPVAKEAYAVLCEKVSPVISGNIMMNLNPKSYFSAVQCHGRANAVIKKNYIYGFSSGINAWDHCNPIIKNNIINSIREGVSSLLHCELEIINNTILVEEYAGIKLIHWSSANVKNNIIIGTEKTMGIASETSDINARYNDVWNHEKNYAGTIAGSGSISADPLFVSSGSQNYQLQENSPCRNSGDPNLAYIDVDETRNDMGAFGGPDPINLDLTSGLIKSISITRNGGFPGDTVSAYIKIEEPAGIFKAEFSISFNKNLLSFIKVDTTLTSGNSQIKTKVTQGMFLHIGMISPSGLEAGPDSVLRIDFKLNPLAHSGDISLLRFKNVIALDKNNENIFFKNISDGFIVTNQGSEPGRYVYVDAANKFSGNGTRANPFQRIQDAINATSSGDTVVVAEGHYPEALILKENVFVLGAEAHLTYLYPPRDQIGIQVDHIQNCKISGFSIIGDDSDPFAMPLLSISSSTVEIGNSHFKAGVINESNIRVENNSHVRFTKNICENTGLSIVNSLPTITQSKFIGNSKSCIRCDTCTSPIIENNEFSTGVFARPPLFIEAGTGAVIKKNILHCEESDAGGIILKNTANVTVKNNIIENGNGGIGITDASNVRVINNTIVSKSVGIKESGSTLVLYNNIVTGNKGYGLQFSEAAIHDYNDSWNPGDNFYQCTPDPNGISQDPLFIDPENAIYLLSPASPCINAGNPESIYNDFDGSRNDIGAYGGPEADKDWLFNRNCAIKADSIQAFENDTICIAINGINVFGAVFFESTISFNPIALDFVDLQASDLCKNFALTQTKKSFSSVRIKLEGLEGIAASEGGLLQLRFIAKSFVDTVSIIHFNDATLSDASARKFKITALKDGIVKITAKPAAQEPEPPIEYKLFQSYPNPFNNSTRIKYRLAETGKVSIIIYNVLGQKVRTFIKPWQESGIHSVVWRGKNDAKTSVSSGLYFYQLKTKGFIQTKKILLLK